MDTSNDDETSTGPLAPDTDGTRMIKLKKILTSEVPVNLYLKFLYQHNHTDMNVLKKIKSLLARGNSVTHNATVICHALMQCGTTNDNFLANNLNWLRDNFKDWAKFMVTASIGVIHRGYASESMKILDLYLPKEGAGAAALNHSNGGALFALGMINTNDTTNRAEYLLNAIRTFPTNESIVHGGCLGLGLTSMASQNMLYYEELKILVFGHSAVSGEAAAIAGGLILMGSGNADVIEELVAFARESHDTQHEKVTRGIAMALAMMNYGREESADALIDDLSGDKDPILRYGAMYTIAMAYVGTANNSAIRRLLHVAVSDTSDDVRRAAVTCLGFVLCNTPTEVPKIVALLSESYNANVRYGACMAVGIACAGTGDTTALALLEPLLRDRVDFVRQASFIAQGMVLMQHNNDKSKRLLKSVFTLLEHPGDTMTKLGATLCTGIMNAGGRNVSIALRSPAGFRKMEAVVGMAMFQQFWYWHPFTYFLALSFTPTTIIGLNSNLQMPEPFRVISHAKPSMYAYPEVMKLEKEKEKIELKKATLSMADKLKAKEARKKNAAAAAAADGGDNEKPGTQEDDADGDAVMGDASDKKEDETASTDTKIVIEEPDYEILSNPSRVTVSQMKTIGYDDNQRYHPVKSLVQGFVMLVDGSPTDAERIVVPTAPGFSTPGISRDEPDPPAPFEVPARYL